MAMRIHEELIDDLDGGADAGSELGPDVYVRDASHYELTPAPIRQPDNQPDGERDSQRAAGR